MGDQSSGKSSVLEAISGIPFPRGSGLVTRCATQLTMKSAPEGYPWRAHISVGWDRAQPSASGLVETPEALTKKIEELTDILCESAKETFSTDCIIVRVESPGAPDLTLIDLPGIVRTATAGQNVSVIGQVNSLISSYLQQDRTIVLAVIPSNQDIATIDILERARSVDPEGVRTLGVLTKPDLIGPGSESEVLAVLNNERKPLKLGYIMVKCRSQRDLDNGVTPQEARESEVAFFNDHPDWKQVRKPVLGISRLTHVLTNLLVDRIQISLPFIKYELQAQADIVNRDLIPLGSSVPLSLAGQRNKLMKIMSVYCSVMRQSARGFYTDQMLAECNEVRLFGLCQVCFEELKSTVDATRPAFGEPEFGVQLAKDMASLRGRELAGFHNSQAFYTFIASSVEGWHPAVERCRAQVVQSARSVSAQVLGRLVPGFPGLYATVTEMATKVINDYADELHDKLDDIVLKESNPFITNENMMDLIDTLRFRNFDRALEQMMTTIDDKGGECSVEDLQAQVITRLGGWYMQCHGINVKSKVEDMTIMIEAYWDVATKRFVDNVCISLEHDFIEKVLKKLEADCFMLVTNSFGPNGAAELAHLFSEDPVVAEKRLNLTNKKERLTAALQTLREMAPDCIAQQQQASE
jgi:interferon-induced GTP-binding protein Mx1